MSWYTFNNYIINKRSDLLNDVMSIQTINCKPSVLLLTSPGVTSNIPHHVYQLSTFRERTDQDSVLGSMSESDTAVDLNTRVITTGRLKSSLRSLILELSFS